MKFIVVKQYLLINYFYLVIFMNILLETNSDFPIK